MGVLDYDLTMAIPDITQPGTLTIAPDQFPLVLARLAYPSASDFEIRSIASELINEVNLELTTPSAPSQIN